MRVPRSRRPETRRARARGEPAEIVFTGSGGTEANALAIEGLAARAAPARRHLIVSAIEHRAVLGASESLTARGWR